MWLSVALLCIARAGAQTCDPSLHVNTCEWSQCKITNDCHGEAFTNECKCNAGLCYYSKTNECLSQYEIQRRDSEDRAQFGADMAKPLAEFEKDIGPDTANWSCQRWLSQFSDASPAACNCCAEAIKTSTNCDEGCQGSFTDNPNLMRARCPTTCRYKLGFLEKRYQDAWDQARKEREAEQANELAYQEAVKIAAEKTEEEKAAQAVVRQAVLDQAAAHKAAEDARKAVREAARKVHPFPEGVVEV